MIQRLAESISVVHEEEWAALAALGQLAVGDGAERLYRAATPGYEQNFSRDSLIAKSLAGDPIALRAQLAYSANYQGASANPVTGEEEGKIHHQLPSAEVNGNQTAYNACDTTAYWLSSIATLAELGQTDLLNTYRENIERGVAYIKRHVRDGLFIEDPALADAERFGLRVTYWKDSILNHEVKEEPVYPVVYSLAHFQNAHALGRIGRLTNNGEIKNLAAQMTATGIAKLWKDDHFVTAIDTEGIIDPPNTDSLHALLYIATRDLPVGYASRIEKYMQPLITKAGYRTGLPVTPGKDDYHTRYVWTHEQALLHAAASRYGLEEAMNVTEHIKAYFNPEETLFPELIDPTMGYTWAGNKLQLWAVCAYLYFRQPSRALL